ncbi:MAG: phenylalanine--tRNA ligase subunit beta [Bacteroidales bacterium]|nr:phenylalanine--tRNA ligase subunit beta [Bacteroidales bacterium]
MKISYIWLKQYVNVELAPERVAQILTDTGLEVENIETVEAIPGGLEGVVIGYVKTCEKHPDSDHLHITTVDVGGEEPLHIVCGASNIAAGQKVAVATVGTALYCGEEPFKIKKSKIRGALSEGMICAEDELCLGASHDGIMVLEPDAVPGTPAKEYFKIENDYIFEIGLTPNRTDAISHIGVARDLLAALKCQSLIEDTLEVNNDVIARAIARSNPEEVNVLDCFTSFAMTGSRTCRTSSECLHIPSIEDFKPDNQSLSVEIEIKDTQACPRYTGIVVKNVTVKESPEWLRNRLTAVGIRPINNIVDIANWVLWEIGQPLHTFDLDKIKGGKVIIRKAKMGEKFVTLDNVERTLHEDDLMICNETDAMCIAGVFGGVGSGITEETKHVFIESAYFDPATIRKTARRHGLQTDASFRYERGANPDITVWAAKRAALMMKEFAGGEIASDIMDIYPNPIEQKKITLTFAQTNRLIGKEIAPETIKKILLALDFEIISENDAELTLLAPYYRVDVTREADVIEEILRIYGYNNIEITDSLRASLSYQPKPNVEKIRNAVADLLAANGFYETINNSLTGQAYFQQMNSFPETHLVKILNPLSSDLNILRPSLLAGGMATISYNINRKMNNLRLFEFGEVYQHNPETDKNEPVTKRYSETRHLGLWLTGKNAHENWREQPKEFNFFDLKMYVHKVLSKLGIDTKQCKTTSANAELFFEGLSYSINNHVIVEFGQVHQIIQKRFDVKQTVFFADFNWKALVKVVGKKNVVFQAVPKFPEVHRDLALLLDADVPFSKIEEIAYATERKFLKEVRLFDIYTGEKLGEGKKSYAVGFTLLDEDKTLEDKQIDRIMNKLMEAFVKEVKAQIR